MHMLYEARRTGSSNRTNALADAHILSILIGQSTTCAAELVLVELLEEFAPYGLKALSIVSVAELYDEP